MTTGDPYGIGHYERPGRELRPWKSERINTNDPMEMVERCLSCEVPPEQCKGACNGRYGKIRERQIKELAGIVYNGGTDRVAMEKLGLSKCKLGRYKASVEFAEEIERLREERRQCAGISAG